MSFLRYLVLGLGLVACSVKADVDPLCEADCGDGKNTCITDCDTTCDDGDEECSLSCERTCDDDYEGCTVDCSN